MTMQENYKDEWLDKAFQLAFFLHGKRGAAKSIAVSAMNKLEIASNAQFKRRYYQPVGRAETSRAVRSRVSLNDLQLLQRLVFVESENFERENEKDKTVGEKNLLVYFIKHLVRISLKRNSFYVTLGIARILHNYATNEVMEIYNIVVQDPERVHDDYYYRSRKGVLMKELKARFGNLLETVKVNRGEERFNHKCGTEDLNEIVKDCLQFFTPWKSVCAIPEKFDPFDDVIQPFYFDKDNPDAEHRIEINRIHAALHPHCFNRLTDVLNLPLPEQKLEIPIFMISESQINNDKDHDNRNNPPHLDATELQTIKDVLAAQAASRRAVSANLLRVVVDGDEYAKINLNETAKIAFDLDGDAELIEVHAVEKDGDVMLATHLLSFDELANGNQTQSVLLEGGQKVLFDLKPALDEYGEVVGINCGVEYAENAQKMPLPLVSEKTSFSLADWFQNLGGFLKPAMAFGLILLAFGFGWLIYRNLHGTKQEIANNPTPQNQEEKIQIAETSANKENRIEKRNVAPKESTNENQNSVENKIQKPNKATPKTENKPKPAPKKEIILQLPQPELQANNNLRKKEDIDENGILRVPIRENSNNFSREINTTRNVKMRGKSLPEMKKLYVEITGDGILGKQISEQIAAEMQKSNLLSIVPNKEEADGRLIIYIRHESDGDEPEDKSVTAIVRLVNAEGFVVFPDKKRISAWKYVGVIGNLPPRIVKDLVSAKIANQVPVKQ